MVGQDDPHSGTDLAERIRTGQSIDLPSIRVLGDLDLRELDVAKPIVCRACVFDGAVNGSHTRFRGVVDLSGSTFNGTLDFTGAVFESALLLAPADDRRSCFNQSVNFTLAAFNGSTSFEGAVFRAGSTFRSAEFSRDVSFANTDFEQDSSFDGATFAGTTVFSGREGLSPPTTRRCSPGRDYEGTFRGAAGFQRSTFKGAADFRQRHFEGDAAFDGTSFLDRASFMQARFRGPGARFDGAHFDDDVSFVGAEITGPSSFDQVTSSGAMRFDGATFSSRASFFNLANTGTLSLRRVTFSQPVRMNNLSSDNLFVDLKSVKKIDSPPIQKDVLKLLEASAKKRGDIGMANDARFAQRTLDGEDNRGLARLWDLVERYFFGYYVRPPHPLWTLVGLVFLAAVVRAAISAGTRKRPKWEPSLLSTRRPAQQSISNLSRRLRQACQVMLKLARGIGAFLLNFPRCFTRSAGLVFSTKPPSVAGTGDAESVGSYLLLAVLVMEFVAYKVLLAIFVINLGNTNSTFRQIIDAVL